MGNNTQPELKETKLSVSSAISELNYSNAETRHNDKKSMAYKKQLLHRAERQQAKQACRKYDEDK